MIANMALLKMYFVVDKSLNKVNLNGEKNVMMSQFIKRGIFDDSF